MELGDLSALTTASIESCSAWPQITPRNGCELTKFASVAKRELPTGRELIHRSGRCASTPQRRPVDRWHKPDGLRQSRSCRDDSEPHRDVEPRGHRLRRSFHSSHDSRLVETRV